jgi:hypothetical protein
MQLEVATQSADIVVDPGLTGTDEEAEAFFGCGGWRRNAMCQRFRLHRNIPTSAGCLIRRGDCAQDVLAGETLDVVEKRATLSSWASDDFAVVSVPALRKPPGAKAPIAFEEIMDALQALDGAGPSQDAGAGRSRHGGPHRVGA